MQVDDAKLARLKRFNLIMFFLHLIQGVFMVALSNDTSFPVYAFLLQFDEATRTLVPSVRVLFELPFGLCVSLFLFLSAIAHLYLATLGYDRYKRNLKLGMNPDRFYEYALSSSLMIVLIGILVGIRDAAALTAMFGANAAMNFFGIMMERLNPGYEKRDVKWAPFVYGCITGVFPWIAIFGYFYGSIYESAAKPPGFVYAIVPTIFVFFSIFALNMFLQYKKAGPWRDYLFGEKMFIVLSLLSKSALAWQIWVGTLMP
jgi:hypothetical protein